MIAIRGTSTVTNYDLTSYELWLLLLIFLLHLLLCLGDNQVAF